MKKVAKRASLIAATAALLAAGWLFVAPPPLGGRTSYVVVRGTSMEPRYHAGDLVVLRGEGDYHVGEIVAYRSSLLHHIVMHRIVAIENGAFSFKGDNNDFVDPEQVPGNALVGKLWLGIPHAGAVYASALAPAHAPVIGALLALLVVGGGAGATVRRRRRGQLDPPAITEVPHPAVARRGFRLGARSTTGLGLVAAVSGGVAVVAGLAALVALARPDSTLGSRNDAYTHIGSFSYSARVPRSTVYPSGRVTEADPVFFKIVRSVRVTFRYSFASRLRHDIRGTTSMDAVLQSPQGWSQRLLLARPQTFSGDATTVSGTLPLARIRQLTTRFQQATGIAQSTYTLTVRPTVSLRGSVGSSAVDTRFDPTLPLAIDAFELQVAAPQTLGATPASTPLSATRSGSVVARTPSSIGIGHFSLHVRSVRRGAAGVAAVAGLVALLAAIAFARGWRTLRNDEHLRIEQQHGDLLVDVARAIMRHGARVVDVASMDNLVHIAERHDRMILHEEVRGRHAYLVEEGDAVYRYSGDLLKPAPNGNRNANGAHAGSRRTA